MLFKNNYCEIVDENFNSLIIQKSKFISYAFKVYDLNQVKRKLDLLKKKHKKAKTPRLKKLINKRLTIPTVLSTCSIHHTA